MGGFKCNCSNPDAAVNAIKARNEYEPGQYFTSGIIHDALDCAVFCATDKTIEDFKTGKYGRNPIKALTGIAKNFSRVIALEMLYEKYDCNESLSSFLGRINVGEASINNL